MQKRGALGHPGVLAVLAAALLFGVATLLAKSLLETVRPWMLAGLPYLGSGVGLALLSASCQYPLSPPFP